MTVDKVAPSLLLRQSLLAALREFHSYGATHNDLDPRHFMVAADSGVQSPPPDCSVVHSHGLAPLDGGMLCWLVSCCAVLVDAMPG